MVSEDHREWGQGKISARPVFSPLKMMLILLIVPYWLWLINVFIPFSWLLACRWRKWNRKKFVTVKNWLSWALNVVHGPTCITIILHCFTIKMTNYTDVNLRRNKDCLFIFSRILTCMIIITNESSRGCWYLHTFIQGLKWPLCLCYHQIFSNNSLNQGH